MKIIRMILLMMGINIFFSSQVASSELDESFLTLKKSKKLHCRFYGESAKLSKHHVAFEKILKSENSIDQFERLAALEENIVAQVYGLLGLWKVDKKKYKKYLLKIKADRIVPCHYTWGPGKLSVSKIFESTEITWRSFLFHKKI